jgi:hypothetical protein
MTSTAFSDIKQTYQQQPSDIHNYDFVYSR